MPQPRQRTVRRTRVASWGSGEGFKTTRAKAVNGVRKSATIPLEQVLAPNFLPQNYRNFFDWISSPMAEPCER